jgi:VanZ family protein
MQVDSRTVKRWAVVPIALILVLLAGASYFSRARMMNLLDPYIDRVMPGITLDERYELIGLTRWSAHFIEYGMFFTALSLGPLRGYPVTALLASVGCALLDEGLQSMRPDRSGSMFDVVVDCGGATTMLMIAMLWCAMPRGWSSAPGRGR